MGRKRKPIEEKKTTLFVRVKQKIVDEMAKEGKPEKIAENIITQKYDRE